MSPATHENIRTISILTIAICMVVLAIWGLNAV